MDRSHRRRVGAAAMTALLAVVLGGCTAQPAAHPSAATTAQPTTAAAADPTDTPAATAAPAASDTPAAAVTSAPGSGDACTLASIADISTAYGQTMTQTSAGPAPFCSFASSDQTEQLIVHTYPDRNNSGLATVMSLESSSEHIDGLGDDAFWNPTIGLMYVRKGERSFTMACTPRVSDPAGWKASIVALATSALANL